jgi:hypothetical protein
MMATLLISEALVEDFQRRALPVLTARAAGSSAAPGDFLTSLLADQARLWVAEVRRPAIGAVYAVEFKPKTPAEIHDTRVYLPELPADIEGRRTVRVLGVYGRSAWCEFVNAPPTQAAAGAARPLLMLACREITLLAEVLPGKDCFFGLAVWANELVPLNFLLQRPEWTVSAAVSLEIALLRRDRLGFAIVCSTCAGSGKLACSRCGGSGEFKPACTCNRCEGRGSWTATCKRCSGSGSFHESCRKCGGSGLYFRGGACNVCGGAGSLTRSCHPCGGSGQVTLPCRACDGKGILPRQECNACQGQGSVPCYRCRGTGRDHARFSPRDGRYTTGADGPEWQVRVLTSQEVEVVNWESGTRFALTGGAAALLAEVTEATRGARALDPQATAALRQHADEFGRIQLCLTRSMAAEGIRETRPVALGPPEPSRRRDPAGVVYDFPLRKGNRPWARDGLLPFPENTTLLLEQRNADGRLEPWEPPWQGDANPGPRDAAPLLLGCRGAGKHMRLELRFSRLIDATRFPPEVLVEPDQPPPPEAAQIQHLRRWCGRDNRDHPVLHALAIAGGPAPLLFGQEEAVRLGTSDRPLVLIKGPPGTGKTTIITRIVQHAAARGQKVLVCSQTHQAVRNVLERLHDIGGFRMLRYGRTENLSPLELSYHESGAGDDFPRQVLERSSAAQARLRQRLDEATTAEAALARARDAARRLDEARRLAAVERRRVDDAFATVVAAADKALSEGSAALAVEVRSLLSPIETRLLATEQELASVGARLGKLRSGRDQNADAYRRATGKSPEVVTVTPSLLKTVRDALLPSWMVSSAALQERYSAAVALIAEEEAREQTLLQQRDASRREAAEVHRRRAEHESALRRQREETLRPATARRVLESAAIDRQLGDTEKPLLPILADARRFATDLDDNSPPEAWEKARQRRVAEAATLREQLAFVASWARDVAADPEALLTCYWDSIQVFFSTCVGLGSWRRLVECGRNAFDLVIVDEAAHATVTETLVPLLYARRALLIGDEMQLPPILIRNVGCDSDCQPALADGDNPAALRMSGCWLQRSLFEWLWHTQPQVPRAMLNRQFRMHPAIADFVGTVFYPEGLSSGVGEADRTLIFSEFSRPVCLIPTSAYRDDRYETYLEAGQPGGNGRGKAGYCNDLEARIVCKIIDKAEAELTRSCSFGVITPYADQGALIRQRLASRLAALQRVQLGEADIASVDSFQGSERDVIIISFVRSPRPCRRCFRSAPAGPVVCPACSGSGLEDHRVSKLTFVRDLRRLNVAFSRARCMLILVGDIEALSDSRFRGGEEGAEVLARFRRHVADRGKVLHLWETGYDRSR